MSIEKAEQYLKEGETEFSAGKLDDAIIKLKAGIVQLEFEVMNKLRLVSLPRTVGRVDIPQVGRVDVPREITEYLKALERGLNDANRALVLSFLGINPYKQRAFTMRSPSVVFAMSGNYQAQLWPNYKPSEDLYHLGHEVLTEFLEKAKSALASRFVTGSDSE